ncbi:hypothetical protein PQ455_06525 [Sphingomonas naphthae]|uniref:Secreted protein n=1 Tax=Sphingomonas naphthae TaxID=1813468 RepID=A0ABY7TNQ9_9SPHN|nr:hypothetical protein [Sphingomonas naphthae]WCT74870.1 hypothetical protein PQ455_06525 [Sphingomonas naphthae]
MRAPMMIAALLASATALPASAQTLPTAPASPTRELPYDRGYDKPSPRTDAINAQEGPVTDTLNAQAGAAATATASADIDAKAVYEADREAYWRALMAHDRSVLRTDERYARQQNAYADAMVAWRMQDAACKRGNQRACKAPTPTPEQFY